MTAAPTNSSQPKTKPRKKRHVFIWGFGILALGAASLTIPAVFQSAVRAVLEFSAWRRGGTVRIEKVEGSLWEPIVLVDSFWNSESPNGAATRIEIARAEASIAWKHLFQRGGAPWFERLSVKGVLGKAVIPLERVEAPAGAAPRSWLSSIIPEPGSAPLPRSIEAADVNFVFQSNDDYIRVEDAHFTASVLESGELRIGAVTFNQPWLRRTFRKVQGKSAMQDSQITLANVVFEPGVELQSLTSDLPGLLRGRLDLTADFALFGGNLRVNSATKPSGGGAMFEAGGTFGQIDIAKLATFLALSDAAGGVIKDGKFSFRGPPRNLARAQASLRFDAVNFQWDSRQWDSLTLGVTLLDRRLQVPQLDLRQGKNELHLSGELVLPSAEQKWWEGDFTANVDAKIENLTELSALVLPEFTYAAGRAEVEGSVRGHAGAFNGQLLVSGSKITWRNAPIETLHAAVKLNGKEIRIVNLDLEQGEDFLRGSGLVKLTSPPVYWGDLRLAVQDLAVYSAFLEKPVLPEPLAGGGVIAWTGEGSSEGHSGKFSAKLRKVRSLGALAQQLHPINADIEATYKPDAMQFSLFSLSDEDSSITANVTVGGKALNLQKIRFTHRGTVQMEGDALLPLDVWQEWPNVSIDKLLNEEVASRVQLTATQLDLGELASLTGWKFPLEGTLDGAFTADGTVKTPVLGGQLALANGSIPIGWTGDLVTGASAKIAFKENAALVESFTGRHAIGDVAIGGGVRFADLRDPALELTLKSPSAKVSLFGPSGAKVEADLDLTVAGPWSKAKVGGNAAVRSVAIAQAPLLADLANPERQFSTPAALKFTSYPWTQWQYEVACWTADWVPLQWRAMEGDSWARSVPAEPAVRPTEAAINIVLTGAGAQAAAAGSVLFRCVEPAADGTFSLAVPGNPDAVRFDGRLDRVPGVAGEPVLDLRIDSSVNGEPVSAKVSGPLDKVARAFEAPASLPKDAIRAKLSGTPPAPPAPSAPAAPAVPAAPAPAPAAPAPAAPPTPLESAPQ